MSRLCLDTTNLGAIEAACEIIKHQPIINSTSAEAERLEKVPLVAKKYNTKLIGLTMEAEGIPDQRRSACQHRAGEAASRAAKRSACRWRDLIIDPLVLTVSGCQQYVPECIEAVRILQVTGAGRAGGAEQRLQRGAERDAAADQPRLLRHVDGRGAGHDDRRPAGQGAERVHPHRRAAR